MTTQPWHRRVIHSALTVFAAVSSTLLIVLLLFWGRSYWWGDTMIGPARGNLRLGVSSSNGWLTVRFRNGNLGLDAFPKWSFQSTSSEAMEKIYQQMEKSIRGTNAKFTRPSPHFGWIEDWGIQFPYWFAMLVAGLLAIASSWAIRWRFGLRSLLVTATILAVALGLLVTFLRSQ